MLKISFTRLSVKSLHDLGRRVLSALNELADGVLKDNPLVADLQQEFEEYDAVVVKKRSMKMGKTVSAKDRSRDKSYRAFQRLLRGMAFFEGTRKGTSAQKILDQMETLDSIPGLNYEEKNTVLDKTIALLETAENTALLTTLGVTEEFAAVKKDQTDFKELADTQSAGNAELQETLYASKSRSDLERSLRNVFALVSAMREQPEWKQLYQLLAQYVKDAESPGKKSGKEPEPAPDPNPASAPTSAAQSESESPSAAQ